MVWMFWAKVLLGGKKGRRESRCSKGCGGKKKKAKAGKEGGQEEKKGVRGAKRGRRKTRELRGAIGLSVRTEGKAGRTPEGYPSKNAPTTSTRLVLTSPGNGKVSSIIVGVCCD